MRRDLYDNKVMDEINVTPLLDLAWTLLVVFIIAVTAAVQGIQVNLPKAAMLSARSSRRLRRSPFRLTEQSIWTAIR